MINISIIIKLECVCFVLFETCTSHTHAHTHMDTHARTHTHTHTHIRLHANSLLHLVLKLCPQLTSLSMDGLTQRTTNKLRAVGAFPMHSNLKRLSAVSSKLSTHTLALLITSCPNLRYLNVKGVSGVTNSVIVRLAQICTHIEYLNVADCLNVADGAVLALARHCTHLAAVNFSWCEDISDDAIAAILAPKPQRSFVSFKIGCLEVETEALEMLKRHTKLRLLICFDVTLSVNNNHCHDHTYLRVMYCS